MRLTLGSLLLFVFSQVVNAEAYFGLHGGVNQGTVTVDPESGFEFSRVSGLILGAFVETTVNTNRNVLIKAEFNYVEKNSQYEGEFSHSPVEGNVNTAEFTVAPFIVVRYFGPQIIPFVEFGPELGFVQSKSVDISVFGNNFSDDMSEYSDNNFSLNYGAGLAILLRGNQMKIGVRYNSGIANMNASEGKAKVKTNGIHILIGYSLRFP